MLRVNAVQMKYPSTYGVLQSKIVILLSMLNLWTLSHVLVYGILKCLLNTLYVSDISLLSNCSCIMISIKIVKYL